MTDPTPPIRGAEDEAGGTAALCENGITATGDHCTGSTHVGGILIRCADSSHTVTFAALLADPTQQLDVEGVVLTAVRNEQERDHLRAEGWRACVDHLQREYRRVADREPSKVPVVMLDGEALWFLKNQHNHWRHPKRPTPSDTEDATPTEQGEEGALVEAFIDGQENVARHFHEQGLVPTTVIATALREHRLEWASYIENWTGAIGPEPPTVEGIIAALRRPEPPFGRAKGDVR